MASLSTGPSMVELTSNPLGECSLTPVLTDIDALPAEQPSVNRPCAGAEHGYAGGEDCQKDVNPLAFWLGRHKEQRDGDLVERY